MAGRDRAKHLESEAHRVGQYGRPERREYPDPAERYEDLHREERDEERRYDEYLDDFDHPEDED